MAIELRNEVSPRDMPSGTALEWQIYKPHKARLQFVVVAPNGDYWVYRDVMFHAEDKIASNAAGENLPEVPPGWKVETVAQRTLRHQLAAEEAHRRALEKIEPVR